MARRRVVTVAVLGLAVASVAIMAGGPGRHAVVSPGQLAQAHMAIAENCSACHDRGADTLIDWVEAAGAGERHDLQNELCLNCHDEFVENATHPHNLAPDALSRVTERMPDQHHAGLAIGAARALLQTPKELACADCHREHHGRDHDLKQLADQQCQVCHRATFHSFAEDHPTFTNYPSQRRTSIHFDHATHYRIHFANFERLMPAGEPPGTPEQIERVAAATCLHCHLQDSAGAHMPVRDYQSMCASCHEGQVTEDDPNVVKPIPFLSIAGLTDEGEPPLQPSHLSVVRMPPIMHLLLSGDPQAEQPLADLSLMDDTDWIKLQADDAQKAALMEAALRLVNELSDDPAAAIASRLTPLAGDAGPDFAAIVAGLSSAGFGPSLRALQQTAPSEDPEVDEAVEAISSGAWSFESVVSTNGTLNYLAYTPQRHADPFVRAWIDLAVRAAPPNALESGAAGAVGHSNVEHAAARMLNYFGNSVSAGRCMKCHTIDRRPDNRWHVNWHSTVASSELRGFTPFSHTPHLVMLSNERACAACHQVEENVDLFRPEFYSHGVQVSVNAASSGCGGIAQLSTTSSCVSCHNPAGTSQQCTTCHNYHVSAGGSSK